MNRDPRKDPQPGDRTADRDGWRFHITHRDVQSVKLDEIRPDGTTASLGRTMALAGWIQTSTDDTVLHVAGEPDSPLVARSDQEAEPDERLMTFDSYQAAARSTAIYGAACDKLAEPGTPANKMLRLSYASLGLGEAGEVQGKIKKLIRDRNGELTTDDRIAIAQELGDLLFYVSATADEIGITLEEIASMNEEKLQDRKARGVLGGSGDNR